MDFAPVEYPPPPIELDHDGTWDARTGAGAFCDLVPRATYDPRHPKCGGCGRFLPVEWACCQACGCECSRCRRWVV